MVPPRRASSPSPGEVMTGLESAESLRASLRRWICSARELSGWGRWGVEKAKGGSDGSSGCSGAPAPAAAPAAAAAAPHRSRRRKRGLKRRKTMRVPA